MPSQKYTIQLTDEQKEGYPVSTETMWFDIESEGLRVKNIPFFIDNISYNDLVSLVLISTNLYAIDRVIERSKNSTLWVLTLKEEGEEWLNTVREMGCSVEGGVFDGYYAINIPSEIDLNDIYALIDLGEKKLLIAVDYPSIRHIL